MGIRATPPDWLLRSPQKALLHTPHLRLIRALTAASGTEPPRRRLVARPRREIDLLQRAEILLEIAGRSDRDRDRIKRDRAAHIPGAERSRRFEDLVNRDR